MSEEVTSHPKKVYFNTSMEDLLTVINECYPQYHFKCDGQPIRMTESTLGCLTEDQFIKF